MKKAEIHEDEAERQATLDDLKILTNGIKEERFDRVTRITRRLFRAPISILSVIDRGRQVFKSSQGVDEPLVLDNRDLSFCAHAIISDSPLIVPDATKDKRFFDNPHVTSGLKIKFYIGQPIRAPNGQRVATLCVIDQKARAVTSEDLFALKDMSVFIEEEIAKNFNGENPEKLEHLVNDVKTNAVRSILKDKITTLRKVVDNRKIERNRRGKKTNNFAG